MQIGITEFKKNMGRYLDLAKSEEIQITKNGKIAARLVSGSTDTEAADEQLFETIQKTIIPPKTK